MEGRLASGKAEMIVVALEQCGGSIWHRVASCGLEQWQPCCVVVL